jgi:hypothetical protein
MNEQELFLKIWDANRALVDIKDILERYEKYFLVSLNSPQDREHFKRGLELLSSIEKTFVSIENEFKVVEK